MLDKTVQLKGDSRDLIDALERATSAWNRYASAAERAKTASGNIASSVNKAKKATKKATSAAKRFELTWKSITRLAAIQLFHRAVSQLSSSLQDATRAAVELELKIAEVTTIDPSNATWEAWAQSIREISDAFGQQLTDEIEGAYQALSNQVVHNIADFDEFSRSVTRFAITARSTTDDAVNLLTAALNAFNKNVQETDHIAANFFKTIEFGRLRAADLANTYGRIAVPANLLGVRMEELNAALAMMTINGVKATEASTFIRNVFLKLIRPTEEMKNYLRELGYETAEAAIEAVSFAGLMKLIEERTQGSTDEIGQLFGRLRAMTGAMLFSNENLEYFNKVLAESEDALLSYDNATSKVVGNIGFRFKREMTQIANYFQLDVADKIIKTVDTWILKIDDLDIAVKALGKGIKASLIPVGVLLVAFAPKIAAITTAIVGLTAVISYVVSGNLRWEESQRRLRETSVRHYRGILREQRATYRKAIKEANEFVDKYNRQWLSGLAALAQRVHIRLKSLSRVHSEHFGHISNLVSDYVSGLETGVRDIDSNMSNMVGTVRTLATEITRLRREQDAANFDTLFETTKDPALLISRINELRSLASKLLPTDSSQYDPNIVRDIDYYYDRINTLTQKLGDLTGVDPIDLQNAAYTEQIALRERLIELAKEQLLQQRAAARREQEYTTRVKEAFAAYEKFDLSDLLDTDSKDALRTRLQDRQQQVAQLANLLLERGRVGEVIGLQRTLRQTEEAVAARQRAIDLEAKRTEFTNLTARDREIRGRLAALGEVDATKTLTARQQTLEVLSSLREYLDPLPRMGVWTEGGENAAALSRLVSKAQSQFASVSNVSISELTNLIATIGRRAADFEASRKDRGLQLPFGIRYLQNIFGGDSDVVGRLVAEFTEKASRQIVLENTLAKAADLQTERRAILQQLEPLSKLVDTEIQLNDTMINLSSAIDRLVNFLERNRLGTPEAPRRDQRIR